MDEFKSILKGKTSFLMGPSGAGKSSLINSICPQLDIRLGEWSERCKTGPQTTTVTQIYPIGEKTYIADTAGFSQVYLNHNSELFCKNRRHKIGLLRMLNLHHHVL